MSATIPQSGIWGGMKSQLPCATPLLMVTKWSLFPVFVLKRREGKGREGKGREGKELGGGGAALEVYMGAFFPA